MAGGYILRFTRSMLIVCKLVFFFFFFLVLTVDLYQPDERVMPITDHIYSVNQSRARQRSPVYG